MMSYGRTGKCSNKKCFPVSTKGKFLYNLAFNGHFAKWVGFCTNYKKKVLNWFSL